MNKTPEEIKNCVVEALSELPETPDEIAAFLLAGGYRAVIGLASQSCPIAVYIQRKCNVEQREVSVGTYHLGIYPQGMSLGAINMEMPNPIVQFIRYYDFKRYLELREEGS